MTPFPAGDIDSSRRRSARLSRHVDETVGVAGRAGRGRCAPRRGAWSRVASRRARPRRGRRSASPPAAGQAQIDRRARARTKARPGGPRSVRASGSGCGEDRFGRPGRGSSPCAVRVPCVFPNRPIEGPTNHPIRPEDRIPPAADDRLRHIGTRAAVATASDAPPRRDAARRGATRRADRTASRTEGATASRTYVLCRPDRSERIVRTSQQRPPDRPSPPRKPSLRAASPRPSSRPPRSPALAAPIGAEASQGADDPAGHVRQESRQLASAPTTAKKASDDSTTSRSRIQSRHRHGRRGTVRRVEDSGVRHARGADDGPNHR